MNIYIGSDHAGYELKEKLNDVPYMLTDGCLEKNTTWLRVLLSRKALHGICQLVKYILNGLF